MKYNRDKWNTKNEKNSQMKILKFGRNCQEYAVRDDMN